MLCVCVGLHAVSPSIKRNAEQESVVCEERTGGVWSKKEGESEMFFCSSQREAPARHPLRAWGAFSATEVRDLKKGDARA